MNNNNAIILSVIVATKINKILDYTIGKDCKYFDCTQDTLSRGSIVSVTMRNKSYIAVVTNIRKAHSEQLSNSNFHIKAIDALYPVILQDNMMKFLEMVSYYNCCDIGMVLKSIVNPIKKPQLTNDKLNSKYNTYNKIIDNIPHLSSLQAQIYNKILSSLYQGYRCFILHGVTGSGKTELYLKSLYEAIAKGGQVLILLPEIVLTTQLLSRFKERLSQQG